MSARAEKASRLEGLLAGLLHYGTWLASAVIAVGLVLALFGGRSGVHDPAAGMGVVTWGIAFLILLPVLRVGLMLIVFVRERDYRFVAIAAVVLLVILAGFVLGLCLSKPVG